MIIVTGGAGFIGSALIAELNSKGYSEILVVDRLGDENKWKNLCNKSFSTFIHKDKFLSFLSTMPTPGSIEAIFHLGACSSTVEKDADYLMENNFQYSQSIFKFCTKHSIPLIYASSAATYGNGTLGYSDNEDLLPKLKPINPYGFSKKIFDSWVLTQVEKPPFYFGLKFFNVYGPNEYHKQGMKSLIAKAVPQILENGYIKLFKSHHPDFEHGEQKRDFIYVKDITKCMMYLFDASRQKNKNVISGIYNLGTGKARSFKDLALAVFKALDKKVHIEWIDMPKNIQNQYQYFTEANLNNLRERTAYLESFASLEEGINDYVKNYLNNNDHALYL